MSFFSAFLSACNFNQNTKVYCPGFEFNRLNIKRKHFETNLLYTNGIDTILLKCYSSEYSKPFLDEGSIYTECNPIYDVSLENDSKSLQISYSFDYFPKEIKKMNFTLQINNSSIEFSLDTLDINHKSIINLGKKFNDFPRIEPNEIIKRIEFYKYRVTFIEKQSGEVWRLIETDSL